MNKCDTKFLFLFLLFIISPLLLLAQVPPSTPMVCATSGADGTTNINGSINTYFPPINNVTLAAGSKKINLAKVPAVDAYGNNFGTVPLPVAPNSLPNGKDNPAGRQLNRRTTFTVISVN